MKGLEFERAAEQFADRIYAVAFHFFKNPYDADDIVQDVLLKLYTEEKNFESPDHLRYWIFRVTVNQCKKVNLSSLFKRQTPLEEYMDGIHYETPEASDLFRAVMDLPKKYRAIVHLYYYEGYSTREIGQLLDCNEATVRTRLRRARNMLKEVLSDGWNDEE